MIEVSKITCEQYLGFSVADPRDINIWLSGYYTGKQIGYCHDVDNDGDCTDAGWSADAKYGCNLYWLDAHRFNKCGVAVFQLTSTWYRLQ